MTTIAPQALTLLNGSLANECARAMADRVAKESSDDAGRVDRVYARSLGRRPDDEERRLAIAFLRSSSLADLCLAAMNVNEFVYID